MSEGYRLLHTMLRVFDLEKSIRFYTELLGMRLLRRTDYEGGRFTLAFIGYGAESETAVIELTHNWDQAEPYTIGSGYGHIAIGVPTATSPSACRTPTPLATVCAPPGRRLRASPAR